MNPVVSRDSGEKGGGDQTEGFSAPSLFPPVPPLG